MEHASLVAFLEGRLAPEQFGEEVADEVRACNLACKQTGEGHVSITSGPNTIVTRDHARRMLEAVVEQRLSLEIANYTTTCIIFGDFEFEDDVVNEAIWLIEMADIDHPSTDDMRIAISRLTLR
ncbi:hypothetical protein [Novosphingobium pokkalii]|uniref:Uncharacterized protein n=1 Tax=Novosphingobium pokkalii TaxID=1770194 RepID=A0ABV7V555_9SPHN|nr:hypothetical protein [Novosphingobium pokkalii]GHC92067.1 hypothetical protein GCM10019060_17630 [Novosphingobium pokkalii]